MAPLRIGVTMLITGGMMVPGLSHAGQASLAWDYTNAGAAGFVLNCGTSSGNYTSRIDVGSNKSFTVTGLTEGTKYYCVVAAYDSAKVDGVPSTEFIVPIPYAKPVVSFTGSPVNATAPANVAFANSTKVKLRRGFGTSATVAPAPVRVRRTSTAMQAAIR